MMSRHSVQAFCSLLSEINILAVRLNHEINILSYRTAKK